MKIKHIFSGAMLCFAAIASGSASANLISVTDSPTGRVTFGGNDIVDWGVLGANTDPVSNPFNISSTGGIGLSVSQSGGGFERRDQPIGWGGNFTDGNTLLWTGGDNAHPMTIVFNSLIQGVGFQINPDDLVETRTRVEVFGAGDTLFGAFDLTTNSVSQQSADFIGFSSDLLDIAKITIAQGVPGVQSDFAINQLSLITTGAQQVPEPATLALLGIGLLGVFSAARRKAS